MNLFLDYQKKIFNNLKNLGKKKLIQIPSQLNLTVELPPKNQNADISCNAAMILAKINNNSPVKLAKTTSKIKPMMLRISPITCVRIFRRSSTGLCPDTGQQAKSPNLG